MRRYAYKCEGKLSLKVVLLEDALLSHSRRFGSVFAHVQRTKKQHIPSTFCKFLHNNYIV